jgi:hypothetical protein
VPRARGAALSPVVILILERTSNDLVIGCRSPPRIASAPSLCRVLRSGRRRRHRPRSSLAVTATGRQRVNESMAMRQILLPSS